jgi:hypothetical protein
MKEYDELIALIHLLHLNSGRRSPIISSTYGVDIERMMDTIMDVDDNSDIHL